MTVSFSQSTVFSLRIVLKAAKERIGQFLRLKEIDSTLYTLINNFREQRIVLAVMLRRIRYNEHISFACLHSAFHRFNEQSNKM